MSRNLNVTYAKAVCIILMVLCHAIFSDAWHVQPVVGMFHMPLFFFLSGYCLKTEYFEKPGRFVWRRIKGAYWPYLKWSVVFLLLHNVMFGLNIYNSEFGATPYGSDDITARLWSIATQMQGHEHLLLGGYWFMRALFLGSLLAFAVSWLTNMICRKTNILYAYGLIFGGGILLALCLSLNYMTEHQIAYRGARYLSPQVLLAAVFFVLGHGFRIFEVRRLNGWMMAGAWALVVVGSFFWKMGMAEQSYSSSRLLPYIVSAVLGTWAVYSLPWSRLTGRVASVMQFVGNNTLTVLTWHFLSFKLVSLLIVNIYSLPMARLAEHPVITDYAVQGWWLVYFLVAMVVTCAIAYCNRWIRSPWLKL